MEADYVKVASTAEIPAGKMKKVKLEGVEVLITNVNGAYYAIGSECTHYGGDLSEGILEGNIVTCPVHGAKFDVTTGKVVSAPVEALGRPDIEDEPLYSVKVEKQDILIKL